MYTVNGHQLRELVKPGKEKERLERNPLANLKITGSKGEIIRKPEEKPNRDNFSITETIHELLNPTCGMSEEEKRKYEAEIMRKLNSGKRLTPEELSYLQMTNPTLYLEAVRIQTMRESMERQLESAKSKEEVQDIYNFFLSHAEEGGLIKGAGTAACEEVMREFEKSDKFKGMEEKAHTDSKNEKVTQDLE